MKRNYMPRFSFSTAMFLLLAAVALASGFRAKSMESIQFAEHLDDTAVTVNGREYRFRDLAVYLTYQEWATQEQAKAYDLEHTSKYWNIHTNGSFVRVAARNFAMDRAVHDAIFYQMALQDRLELTPQERQYMANQKQDFWNDLEEEGQERLGIPETEIETQFEQIALAQKAQQAYADREGVDNREYDVDGSMYQELLKQYTYEVNNKLWKRLNFGNITL